MSALTTCNNCGHLAQSDREVMEWALTREMPRRIPNKWDVKDLVRTVFAVIESLGYSKPSEESL